MSAKLVIKIVDKGTDYTNQDNQETHPSLTGHMWWELYDDSGQVIGSFGFAPEEEGSPWGPGKAKYDDNIAYDFNPSNGDYQKEFEITDSQFEELKKFGENPFDDKYGFDSQYNGLKNSCIDFTWKSLAIAGLIEVDENGNYFDGDIIPTWNIDNIERLALDGQGADLQKKTLQDLGKTFEEYVAFIEDYYSVKTTTLDSFSDLLTKYNLNTNLDNYSNIAPSFIVNDGNGNNFNLSAFPNFSDLFENNSEYQNQFFSQFFDQSFLTLNYDINQFNNFLNENELSLSDFTSEVSDFFQINSDSESNFSTAFDEYFENSFLNELNLDSNLFESEMTVEGGEYQFEYSIDSEELDFEEQDLESLMVSETESVEFSLNEGSLEDFLFEQGYRDINDLNDDLEIEYSRLNDIFAQDLQNEQSDLIDRMNSELEEFIAQNPSAVEDEILSFISQYDYEWDSIVTSLIANLQINIESLLDEYESYRYYNSDSFTYEYFEGSLIEDVGLDWNFDPLEFDGGEGLYGFGYYKEGLAFSPDDTDEFGDYWVEFDSNGDDLIDEGEYELGENFDYFAEWYDNSNEYWIGLEEAFSELLDVRFESIWTWGYEEIYAFDPSDMGEYESYWYDFDYNSDGLVDESEYDEDWDSFINWYMDSWVWETPDDAYDYAHDVNFEEHWVEAEILVNAFAIDSTGNEEYWRNFDYNDDGLIDEDEYEENINIFADGYYDSDSYWQSLEMAFEEALEANFYENYVFVEDYYDMTEYWDINVGANFESFYTDFSELRLDNFLSASFWNMEVASSWEPGEIYFNVDFNGSFNFEIEAINQSFEDFLYNLNYQPIYNLPISDLSEFYEQSYELLNADISQNVIEGSDNNEIITASASSVKINGGGGFDIINGGLESEEINGGDGNDILIGNDGDNILQGEFGDDVYVFSSTNLANDEITDDDGVIILDNKILAGTAIQEGITQDYKLGDYLLRKEDGDLRIFYGNSSILIKNFENKTFGIELNDNPEVDFNEVTLNEDGEIIFNILEKTSDADGDDLSFYYSYNSDNGSIEVQENGVFKYTANENFSGLDIFEYLVSDGNGGVITKTLNITVNQVNDAPTISSIITPSSVDEDTISIVVSASAIASSFSDIDGDNLTYSASLNDGNPLPSWLSVNNVTGEIISTNPSNSDIGSYNIKVIATDPSLTSISQDFVVTVNNINDAPTASLISSSTIEDANSITLAFNGSDIDTGDSLTYTIITNPALGTIINNNDGTFSYNLGNNFQNLAIGQSTNITFTYQATDLNGASSNISTATIAITGNNDIPTASITTSTTNEDNSITIDVLTGASDIDSGNILTISSVTNASHGVVSITTDVNSKQVISYIPNSNYNGTDKFSYTISDGNGGMVTKELTVTVNAVNDAPIAVSTIPTQLGKAGNVFSYTIPTGLFTDIDNDALIYSAKQSNGSDLPSWLIFNSSTKTFSGTPASGIATTLSILITASDESLFTTQTLNINITSNVINGTTGNNTLTGTNDNDVIYGDAGNDAIRAGLGNDNINGGLGIDTIFGGLGSDTIDGGEGSDKLYYTDSITGVTINLTTNINTEGTAEGDIISNIEKLYGSNYDDNVTGDSSNNTLSGNAGNDTINGELGNDALYGNDGNDNINGGSGIDTIFGGLGSDTIDGGEDSDKLYYTDSTTGVTINLTTNINAGGTAEGDIISNIEKLYGSNYDDNITGDSSNNTINGNSGNDTINGESGNDALYGNDGNDNINGGLGNDSIFGGLGADTINGGDGTDNLYYTDSTTGVTINLTTNINSGGTAEGDIISNIEKLYASNYDDNVTGDSLNNTLSGNVGNDIINGEAGNDALYGNNGNDTINGGVGNDSIYGGLGSDIIDGGVGTDNSYYTDSTTGVTINLTTNINSGGSAEGDIISNIEKLYGSNYDDNITGNSSSNSISGNVGNDTINGESGNDTLYGNDGNDQLIGGLGKDTLVGGLGSDIFTFTNLADSSINSSDLITDFTKGEDQINLSNLNFTNITNDINQTDDSVLTYYYDTTNNQTVIENEDHAFKIKLSGNVGLDVSDFDFV